MLKILARTSMILSNMIKARKITQNGQEFLVGTFSYKQIKEFTKFTERLIVGYDDSEEAITPIYNKQIQRKANPTKVSRIADFLINDNIAIFPTNIVIALPLEVIDSISQADNEVEIQLNTKVKDELMKVDGDVYLTIIDGQHRIRGIERAIEILTKDINDAQNNLSEIKKLELKKNQLENILNMELIVTFFIDPTLEYQAMIFSTINRTQTKVPENLVYSLFGLTDKDSPQKTALEVVLALNGIKESPFFQRIKLVGGEYQRGQNPPLSQATMVKSIINNICNSIRDAEEIDRFKLRSEFKTNPKNLQFRYYYAITEDRMIIRILFSFFKAVQKTFTNDEGYSLWDLNKDNKSLNILQTNVGYQALLKILLKILPELSENDKDKIVTYSNYLEKAKDIDFIDDKEEKRYPFTSKSINILYGDLASKIWD